MAGQGHIESPWFGPGAKAPGATTQDQAIDTVRVDSSAQSAVATR